LGTEAANACLNYGFQVLNFEKIFSFTSIHNTASEKLMQKIGMQKITEFDHPKLAASDFLCKHVLYQIQK
jgi:RimJ/RimL family protein N-acetyltransferase